MQKGERFNSITHSVGAVLAVFGLALLVVLAARQGDPWKIVGFSIYGATLVMLYTSSAIYHSLQGGSKKIFRTFDHLSIYLLIAGTYTPLTLITLRGGWGWSIFGVIWGLAIIGIVLETVPKKKKHVLTVIIYLFMGWLIVVAFKPMLQLLPPKALTWLIVGGMFYTSGVIFYAFDNKVRYFHGVWHLFVLAGSFSHYLTMIHLAV